MSGNPGARWDAFWWIAGIILVLVTSLSLAWCYWEELRGNQESLSTTVRNVGLVIGGAIAILFAAWRSIVAEKQAATAQRGLLNERYQQGAEMLGSEQLSVRLGGIYALARLAREHPGDYHTQIMRLLCAFVRNPSGKPVEAPLPTNDLTAQAEFGGGFESYDEDDYDAGGQLREGVEVRPQRVREDIQAVMTAIGQRSNEQINAEEGEKYGLDLREADLKTVYLADANLERANLYRANLEGAVIIGSNLDRAHLYEANLHGASLLGSTLRSSNLTVADLSAADLRKCTTLTQEQLDRALAHEGPPPDLTGAVDADTREPLVWRGGSITEQ